MIRFLAALFLALPLFAAGPKVLILYDMEGLSGIDRHSYTTASSPDYAQGRQWLTSDVNAAIRGLYAGGAGSVWVVDGHGSGSTEPDILLDQMDARARFDFREREFDQYSTGIDASLAAIVCIGMHARAGTNGFLAHTYSYEPGFRINGVDITETQIVALSAARFGIPVIMVSGDDVLGEQLRPEFPELEYAVVKTARGRARAEAVPQDEVQRRIEYAARAAMEKFLAGRFRPYYLRPPFVFELTFQNYEQTTRTLRDTSIERTGPFSIRYQRATFIEGYEYSKHLMSLAAAERMSLLLKAVRQHPEGRKILAEYQKLLIDRWLEPDQLPEWAKDTPPPPPRKRFHGAN
jgi:D-amino peptidase